MEILFLHFAVFILGVLVSCSIFMMCFMPIYKHVNGWTHHQGEKNNG